ncbi:TetR/AcrR family transcriptional regulator [Lactiplantibacillus plantarum]
MVISIRTELDLQRAMYQLLEQRSISQITVEQICKQAFIHRSSFYRYYTDKFDLLRQMVMHTLDELLAAERLIRLVRQLCRRLSGRTRKFYDIY